MVLILSNYYCSGQLSEAIEQYLVYYNTGWCHESLDILTLQDGYLGRGEQILKQRKNNKTT